MQAKRSNKHPERVVCGHPSCGEKLAEVRTYHARGQEHSLLTFPPLWVFSRETGWHRSGRLETQVRLGWPTVPAYDHSLQSVTRTNARGELETFEFLAIDPAQIEEGWAIGWLSNYGEGETIAVCPECGRHNTLDADALRVSTLEQVRG